MLENAIYSILSPEGFASILYKDSSKCKEVAEQMKLTAYDLKNLGIIDKMILEDKIETEKGFSQVTKRIKESLKQDIAELKKIEQEELIENRYQKYRQIGK